LTENDADDQYVWYPDPTKRNDSLLAG